MLVSILEVEYIAISYRIREKINICQLLNKLLLKQVVKKIKILRDNKTSLTLTKDSKSQNYTKHIDVIYHYI